MSLFFLHSGESESMSNNKSREVIFEYTRVGNSVRVTAIDAESGTEVTFQAPANTNPSDMQKMAIRKLRYVMEKQKASATGKGRT